MQTPGPAFGFNPGIDNEDEIGAMESDLQQLADEGFVRLAGGTSPSVVCKLTSSAIVLNVVRLAD
jgi:hypothetical protein